MNCLTLTSEQLFEQSLLNIMAGSSEISDRWLADATLFDNPWGIPQRQWPEAHHHPEEDAERWDGLS